MKIVMTGGTGLVGSRIIEKYKTEHEFYILTRHDQESENNITYINWGEDGWEKEMPAEVDAVINLAGATLQKRWTKSYKEQIMKSRIETTEKLYEYFKNNKAPECVFNTSAVGYYPPAKTLTYDESNEFMPHDFLSDVVYQWEKRAHQFEQLGSRLIIGRFGVIFSHKGGALPVMMKPYELFGGGKIGDGKQWMSWIHIDDLVDATMYLITHNAEGIYNLTSPYPVTQDELGKTIGKYTHRPHYFKVPAPMMKVILGEQSDMVLNTQKVIPKKLIDSNYMFKYPRVDEAMADLVKKDE